MSQTPTQIRRHAQIDAMPEADVRELAKQSTDILFASGAVGWTKPETEREVASISYGVANGMRPADAAFIAETRTLAPAIAADVKALDEKLTEANRYAAELGERLMKEQHRNKALIAQWSEATSRRQAAEQELAELRKAGAP